MTIDLQILLSRESEQVEWKENVADFRDVVRTLVAFANDLANLGGGRVVCGVAEDNEIEGKVMTWCRERVHPPIVPIVEELPGPDPANRILIFTIAATRHAHVLRDDGGSRYWVRSSRATIEARNGLVLRLLSAKGEVEAWDHRINPDATLEDIDLLALRDALVRMKRWDDDSDLARWLSPDIQLSIFIPPLCGILPHTTTVRPRNFTLLLFGRNPQRFVPGSYTTFSKYPGPDRTEPYSERLDIGGTLLNQATALLAQLEKEAIRTTDKSSGADSNTWRYPLRALSETVINALVHRDYTSYQPTRIVAYSDQIEVWSPGGLDPKVRVEDFRLGSASPVWRNRALAWFFIDLRLAQAEGQGIKTIVRSMAQAGNPHPVFEPGEETMRCVLHAHPRQGRVALLQEVEAKFHAGEIEQATTTLETLLADDPYNFRTLALLAELARAAQDSTAVLQFLNAHRDDLDRFPAAAQLTLAEALLLPPGDPERCRALLVRAEQGHMELPFARRLLLVWLAMGDRSAAQIAFQRVWREHPDWQDNPIFTSLRARFALP